MSPSRFPLADTMDRTSPIGAPTMVQISMAPVSARTRAWRNRTAPPSSLTTRSPMAILPSVLPLVRVSNTVG